MSADGKPWSIRRRLSRRVLVLVSLAWIASIGLATLFLDHEINEILDEELQAVADTTVLYLDATPGQVIPRSIGVKPGPGERLLRILRQGDPPPDAPWPALTEDGFYHVAGWRVLRVTAENAVIEVAHNDAWRREEMIEAASAFTVLFVPMIALLIWGLRASLRQGFARLEQLADSVAARGPGDQTSFPDVDLPIELKPLTTGLNQYIARISDLRRSERQFIANASHELRTPVAAIRARLDLSDDAEARAALPLLDGLTRRVERLLQLSRSDSGLGIGGGVADLAQIVRLLVREVGRTPRHPIHYDDGDIETMPVNADPDALAIVIRNLLENAVEHGDGTALVRLDPGCLSISNPATDAAFPDQPFAKRPGSSGLGLGLSIVAQLTDVMGITVERQYADDVAKVVLRFASVDGVDAPS